VGDGGVATPVTLETNGGRALQRVLMVLAVFLLLGLTFAPPLVSQVLSRRRRS
jgi:hypothetical protein